MKRRLAIVLCIAMLVSLAVGGCAALTKRAGGAVATRVLGKVQGGSAASATPTQAAQPTTEEEQAEPTPQPPANTDANPPSGGGTESGGCFEGFPRYPGVKDSEEAQSMARILMTAGFSEYRGYSSADPVDKVAAFYGQEPANLGWEPAPIQSQSEDGATLWWSAAVGVVHIVISEGDGGGALIAEVCQAAEK